MKRDKKARTRRRTQLLSRRETENKRMSVLATELGYAGTQVLIDDYGFSQDQANDWLEKMIARAKANRAAQS